MRCYAGNIHIHSTYSDGTGTIPEIAEAAREAGLDFLVVTDHQDYRAFREEGNYRGVLVLAGIEWNYRANHYLALDLGQEPYGYREDYASCPQRAIDLVREQGGFGFLAHPFEKGSPYISNGKAFPWTGEEVDGFDGIEIWNYSSEWKSRSQSALKMLYWYFCHRDAPVLQGPLPECLEWWDRLLQERPPVMALGGTDAHRILFRLGSVKMIIFPYTHLFRTINTYLWLEEALDQEFAAARRQILNALRRGCSFISMDRVHSGKGFYLGACNRQTEVPLGSRLTMDEETYLKIEQPSSRGLIRVIYRGKVIEEARARELRLPVTSPGAYRVEVCYRPLLGKPHPWIYSNPVYLDRA